MRVILIGLLKSEARHNYIDIAPAERTGDLLVLLAIPDFYKAVTTKNVPAIGLNFLIDVTVADSAVLGINFGVDHGSLEP